MRINILFPVLNEESRLRNGIEKTISYIEKIVSDTEWELTIIDNGSTDRTAEISKNLSQTYRNVSYKYIQEKGVGAAFRAGVSSNTCDIVGYMDIDLSTDLEHLSEMDSIFRTDNHVDIVNASRYSKDSVLQGRKWYRNIISYILVIILKILFHMKASDAICGFKFFKKEVAEDLIKESSEEPGWFFLIEILLRAERKKCVIYELPVKWIYESHTKVRIWKVTLNYIIHIWRLLWEFQRS